MNSNIYYSNEDPNSNFGGDWDSVCQYCNRPHREHIWNQHPDPSYLHRMPCNPQKQAILNVHNRGVFSIKAFIFIGWVLVPLIIAILGFADPIVGGILLVVSIFKIGLTFMKHFGNPEKWIPGFKDKADKERRMKHCLYHCELNPEGFERLKEENLGSL